MRHLAVCLGLAAAAASQLVAPTAASACPSSSSSNSHLLGVDPDGNFVRYFYSWGENADGSTQGFVAYDKDGKSLSTLTIEGETLTPDGSDFFSAVVRSQVVDPKIIEANLIASKQLEKPTPRKMRHVKSETQCGSLEIESKSGWLRVAEVGTLSYQFEDACPPITASAFEHPKVNVVFVRAKYRLGERPKKETDYSTYEENDDLLLLPKARVEGAELALLGERARLDHDLAKAIPLLERAIRIAPEYLPARASVIRAYAKEERSWESLLPLLNTPISEGVTQIGIGPSTRLLAELPKLWPDAEAPEEGWAWGHGQTSPFGNSFLHDAS
jgi:hypothetical protein